MSVRETSNSNSRARHKYCVFLSAFLLGINSFFCTAASSPTLKSLLSCSRGQRAKSYELSKSVSENNFAKWSKRSKRESTDEDIDCSTATAEQGISAFRQTKFSMIFYSLHLPSILRAAAAPLLTAAFLTSTKIMSQTFIFNHRLLIKCNCTF